jgi:hypothetical protein
MDEFRTVAKLWPSGDDLDLGTDSNSVTVPSSFNRHAANFVTASDGATAYQFLFWNTGRHLTNKRHVRWNFSVGGWGVWTATRWYGTPPTGTGPNPKLVSVDPFTIGGDAILTGGTAIDGAASTFPGGAWPSGGNDHLVSTATGPVTIVAKDPFQSYQFAGWLRLVFGGDDSGEFIETDTGSAPGTPGFFEHSSGPYSVPQDGNATLLATYGFHDHGGIGRIPDWIWKIIAERGPIEIPQKGDPSPMDLIRLKILEDLLRQTRPGPAAGTDYESLIRGAPAMSADELRRAVRSIKTSLNLGKTALAALEARLKKK